MTSKNSLTTAQETPFDKTSQKDIGSIKPEIKESQMTLKTLVASILLSSSLFIASEVQARPNMTDEQLTKARETASQMKPPVDIETLFNEMDRLGIECTGDLTRRVMLKICATKVDNAKIDEDIEASKERQAKLRENNAKLDEENARLDKEYQAMEDDLRKKVNDLADSAQKKLDEMGKDSK